MEPIKCSNCGKLLSGNGDVKCPQCNADLACTPEGCKCPQCDIIIQASDVVCVDCQG